jgi:hypothetical protein
MALAEDSAIAIFRATGDGYFVSVYQYDVSPPPTIAAVGTALESNEFAPTSEAN